MRSLFRRLMTTLATLATALAAVPARADTLGDAQAMAGRAGTAIQLWAQSWAQGLARGDALAIESGSFVLSGLVALTGLWLLVRRPRRVIVEEPVVDAPELPELALEELAPPEPERPRRLLEAITAAKAQMDISEAERKHAR